MFSHVKTTELDNNLHISHLYGYVSAYEYSKEECEELVEQIEQALIEANKTYRGIIVDRDGEMFFVVYPNGMISLCLRWKNYEIIREDQQ